MVDRKIFCASLALWLAAGILTTLSARAQEAEIRRQLGGATGTVALEKEAAAKADGTSEKKTSDGLGQRRESEVTDAEQLTFRQAKVGAEMTELEERMFRLAEALKALEPENASRLTIGLKFAREELLVHQMKEIQAALDKLNLTDASVEQKELLTKLQRLHDLLMSSDLDFQLKLERIRMLRQILAKLDTAIAEEQREHEQSAEAAKKEEELQRLTKRAATLEELIKRQTEHVAAGKKLIDAPASPTDAAKTQAEGGEAESSGPAGLAKAQESTQTDTKTLATVAERPQEKSLHLDGAVEKMGAAVDSLRKEAAKEALPEQAQALELLKKEQAEIEDLKKSLKEELALEKFMRMKSDQESNRQMTDAITDMVRQLGDNGSSAAGELARASGNMSGAEGNLGNQQPSPASDNQEKALASLKFARKQLGEELDKLLGEVRPEIKKRVLEGLALMLEAQTRVRESTETLGPQVKQGSRRALSSVAALSRSEQKIADQANELITLVEETEFAIALPAALSVVRDAMEDVRDQLAKGDASEEVVGAEKQIEADLKDLLDAMKQLPGKGGSGKNRGNQPSDREQELNRIVAELKMIRLLQVRLNSNTLNVDKNRTAEAEAISTALQQRIEDLRDRQEDIRDVTERLNELRADELPQ